MELENCLNDFASLLAMLKCILEYRRLFVRKRKQDFFLSILSIGPLYTVTVFFFFKFLPANSIDDQFTRDFD